jgi:hypothetical protein
VPDARARTALPTVPRTPATTPVTPTVRFSFVSVFSEFLFSTYSSFLTCFRPVHSPRQRGRVRPRLLEDRILQDLQQLDRRRRLRPSSLSLVPSKRLVYPFFLRIFTTTPLFPAFALSLSAGSGSPFTPYVLLFPPSRRRFCNSQTQQAVSLFFQERSESRGVAE